MPHTLLNRFQTALSKAYPNLDTPSLIRLGSLDALKSLPDSNTGVFLCCVMNTCPFCIGLEQALVTLAKEMDEYNKLNRSKNLTIMIFDDVPDDEATQDFVTNKLRVSGFPSFFIAHPAYDNVKLNSNVFSWESSRVVTHRTNDEVVKSLPTRTIINDLNARLK